MPEIPKKNVLIIQRAIPHYRMPLFKALNKSKLFNFIFCVGKHNQDISTGVESNDLGDLNIIHADVKILGYKFMFQKIVSLKNIDIIITEVSINVLSMPLYIAYAKLKGIKVVGWSKGALQDLSKKEPILKKLYIKMIAIVCDRLILYGNVSKNYYLNKGIDEKKLVIAQNTLVTESLIDNKQKFIEKANRLKSEMGLENKFIFGYFGKLSKRKKVDCIIDSFVKHKQITGSDDVLIIAGIGTEKINLEKIAKKSKFYDSIIFLGKVEVGNEGVIINLFDVYLSFSQAGLGILEAMALSKLIICTPELFPETELLVNNYNCILSDDFSIDSYVNAMIKAKNLDVDRYELERNAVQTVREKATIKNMLKAFQYTLSSME